MARKSSLKISHYLSASSRAAARKAAAGDFPKSATEHLEKTPCFIVSEAALRRNLEILASVKSKTGAKILMALKAFAMHSAFPIMREYLDGVCASGPNEARVGSTLFQKEVHTFGPAYSREGLEEILKYSDVIIFNSISQWKRYRATVAGSKRKVAIGLRINPMHAEIATDLYNPVLPEAGLGIMPGELEGEDLSGVEGLHFHALCEQDADVLVRVLASFEKHCGKYLQKMKWVNFGGGHHITRADYDVELLIRTINSFKQRYNVQVHLEPGEAIALNAGVLVSKVLDVIERKDSTGKNNVQMAILDTSAETHMPDVLAMPYKPDILGCGEVGEKRYSYRLRGLTCLAGDIIGEYSFDEKLKVGDRLVFLDMAIYTMVKTTTFNGIGLPSIALLRIGKGKAEAVKDFGYKEYLERLS